MRNLCAVVAASVLAVIGFLTVNISPPPALAAFHCMRIHAVKSGSGGNPNVQYVELRMDFGGQSFIAGHTVQFLDATGTLKATFTFPASVTNASTGDSILIATNEFNAVAQGGAADFTFSNANTAASNGGDPLHPIQSPNGKVIYAAGSLNCSATSPVDSVAYGTAPPDFGTAAIAMPGVHDVRAPRLSNLHTNPMDNSAEYSLQPVSNTTFSVSMANLTTDFTTPRNNGRVVLVLPQPPFVGGIAEAPDIQPANATTGHGGHRTWLVLVLAASFVAIGGGAGAWTLRLRRVRPH